MKYYKFIDGKIIPTNCVVDWGKWMEKGDRVIQKDTKIIKGNKVLVSTVFLGIDYSFDGGEPLLFETMIFGGDRDGYMERYTTKEKAILGHYRIAKKFLE